MFREIIVTLATVHFTHWLRNAAHSQDTCVMQLIPKTPIIHSLAIFYIYIVVNCWSYEPGDNIWTTYLSQIIIYLNIYTFLFIIIHKAAHDQSRASRGRLSSRHDLVDSNAALCCTLRSPPHCNSSNLSIPLLYILLSVQFRFFCEDSNLIFHKQFAKIKPWSYNESL